MLASVTIVTNRWSGVLTRRNRDIIGHLDPTLQQAHASEYR